MARADETPELEILIRDALRELDEEDAAAFDEPLRESDRERLRAYMKAGFRPGMTPEQAAALQEAAVQDLLHALEQDTSESPIQALTREVRKLGRVVEAIKEARLSTAKRG